MVYTKAASEADYVQSYELRQAFVIFMARILVLEIIILGVHLLSTFALDLFSTPPRLVGYSLITLELLLIHLLNTVLVIYKTLSWYNGYYVISTRALTKIEGVLNRNSESQDIRTVSSVRVKQSWLGFLFNFGTVTVENPFSKNQIRLNNVTHPHRWATEIKQLHEHALEKRPFTDQEHAHLAKFN